MEISGTPMIVLATLGCALLAALALRMIFAPEAREEKTRSARIRAMRPERASDTAHALVKSSAAPMLGLTLPVVGNLPLLLRRADMEGREFSLGLIVLAAGTLTGAGMSFFLVPIIAFPAGLALAAFLAFKVLSARHEKRMTALTQQLPDALDLMMRGLRVGHPINATIANVGRTMADPVGAEFRQLAEQIAHGDYLTDAFRDFAERTGQEDVEYLSVSISIQHGTGGNLAEMLGTLSKVVRDRIIMRRRIKAISSEGRISAYLLSALPVVIYVATSLTAPDYYSDVSDDPLFKPIAVAIVVLVVANFLTLRKLVNFKV
ncbi:type II secretion system F family protein [Sulfitobacter albidus]|uniref:Type II secretion system F family protein n=1 Tax=Sulfitobacter albidus TaxID=2829501 RepID=A0A975JDZ7_9RHOB|nr:type II secretion system F family protein [Sulfitobacter albidus]QUJ76703.1 type II secretion system F family protein [Sulfitobacter albidus]